MKKALRWTVKILLVFLVVFAGFVAEENIRGRIALAHYTAELRAKGEKLTLAELDLSIPTKEGNGAEDLLAAADELELLRHQRRGDGLGDEFDAERYLP